MAVPKTSGLVPYRRLLLRTPVYIGHCPARRRISPARATYTAAGNSS